MFKKMDMTDFTLLIHYLGALCFAIFLLIKDFTYDQTIIILIVILSFLIFGHAKYNTTRIDELIEKYKEDK